MAVVVGYVPTREGRAALEHAARECTRRNTRLVVVNSAKVERNPARDETRKFEESLEQIRRVLDQAGISHEERVLAHGNEPAEDLIEVAEELDAECIVIGLRRRTPIGKLFLGSNAQRILLEAGCPVIAVKAAPVSRSV
ncbi:universal stress protein [Gephyromycinifex aptenodytis]|uniref:universal stress protein n=1 Tax=Gephyromycinifex aptenodytis TaxID=2716227 RepID=UPI0014461BFF|nr:universal stress protein [Gephyromycinifex aptenodytis]